MVIHLKRSHVNDVITSGVAMGGFLFFDEGDETSMSEKYKHQNLISDVSSEVGLRPQVMKSLRSKL